MFSVQVTKGDVKVTGMAAKLEDLAAVKKSLEDFLEGKVGVEKSETSTTAGTQNLEKKPRKTKEKVDDNSNTGSESGQEDDKESVIEEASNEEKGGDKKVSKETSKKPKVSLAKGVAYDKTNPTHKTLIGGFMDAEIPGWRSPKTIHKAKHASETLFASGADLLDRDGEILESFKQKFLELYKSVE